LVHPNEHAFTLNICDLEAHHFTDPQARRIRGHQEGAVLGMLGRGKEAVKFLDAEHTGEPLALGAGWEVKAGQGPAEGLDIQEADGCGGNITCTPGQLAFDEEVMEIGTNLVGGQVLRGAAIKGGEAGDFPKIERLRPRGKAV
jgi:hypothetical protein